MGKENVQMKKIAVIIPSFAVGGAEAMVVQLLGHIDPKRFEILVIVLYDRVSTHIQDAADKIQWEVVYLKKGKEQKLTGFYRMYRCLSRFHPDIIHTHLSFIYTVPWVMSHKVILIHTVHCSPFEDRYKKVLALLARSRKLVQIAISQKIDEELKALYSTDNIEMIPNPVNVRRFSVTDRSYEKDELTFVCVGRLEAVKNHRFLLDGFRKLTEKYPCQKLQIVGDGSYRSKLEKYVKRSNLEEQVTFTGAVSNVEDIYENADVFVLVSRSEGLPMSVLEAMASGLPVITTDVGGLPDVVKGNGILVSVDEVQSLTDAMEYMILHKHERKVMGRAGKYMAEKYDIDKIAARYEELFMKYAK